MSRVVEQIAEIAGVCDKAVRQSGEQWSALCPAHEDHNASLRLGAGEDGRPVLNCLAGCDYDEVRTALVARGVPEQLLRPAARQQASAPALRPVRARQSAAGKPLPASADLTKWHHRLWREETLEAERLYLRQTRGLDRSTLMRFEIGHYYGRYTFPIRDARGDLVNVRRYSPAGHNGKMINWAGHGQATLYPLDVLADAYEGEPVILTEGELDALVAGQHGFTALTGTGGASSPPTDLEPLRGRSVFVVYDCDDAGRRGAQQVAGLLLAVAKEVYVVDLGLGPGEDLTDWFVTHRRTDDDLNALLARATPYVVGENEEDQPEDEDLFVTLADVEETTLHWLWAGRIPAGKLTMLEGDPGLGKSMLWAKIVAHVTTGEPLPGDGSVNDPADVLVVCAEDDLSDTIIPRLRAADADMRRVHSMKLQRDDAGHLLPLSIPEDLPRLRRAVQRSGAALVIFDPVTAYLSETINSGNDASVRRALTPLSEIAQHSGAAVLMIRHLNKQGDLKALYRGGGSIAFIGAARSGLVVDRHPEDERTVVLAQTKSNLARGVPALTYRVEGWFKDALIPIITWGNELDISADDLLKKPDGRTNAPQRDEAVQFLRELLADGPVKAGEVQRAAREAGIAWRTVERAKEQATVRTRRARDEAGRTLVWEWFIPRVHISAGQTS